MPEEYSENNFIFTFLCHKNVSVLVIRLAYLIESVFCDKNYGPGNLSAYVNDVKDIFL